ncbi:TIGR02710 family CRISPR-associated CARF protein [Caldovatus aquaticus]|uniref:TIGR02710 family CRISPR-associated protein n=1 Tax=Caldovatus aquaticus TaxID=2865671 RepID=A0ABS7F120_9PROT|nr:TIGR02710 family CRISPR-associated CARF protein [Caldovatus aquaticus]MBW8269023.1 TIGR02710 family CRISPR-associated protein [Caldovatus aquaticus]
MSLVLIASVGGSPNPIASAIAAKRPEHVIFLATEASGAQPGSAEQIPDILTKAQRPQQPHEILIVPPDEPEAIFLALRERLERLRAEQPRAQLLFDYTGGTKTMTGALFQAAIATPGAQVQFMLGRRENLDRVKDGTERPVRIATDWLIAERTEARLREAWSTHDYATAAAGFAQLADDLGADEKAPPEARARLADLAAVSRAFDLWDRFRHAEAAADLRALAARRPALGPFAEQAQACARSMPARLLDLWRNAERCAARGRYDDAVARLYRLTEWIAQWWLAHRHKIDPDKVDWSRITPQEVARAGLGEQAGKKTLSGLMQAWKLIAAKEPEGPVARFLAARFPHRDPEKTGEGLLRDVLDLRNRSILAHGERPLGEGEWEKWRAFADRMREQVLVPLLRAAGENASLPPQLPQDPAALGL